MRYTLRKAPGRNLYWVVDQSGRHHSADPIPKARAEAQMRALYASQSGGTIMNRVRALNDKKAQLATLQQQWAERLSALPRPVLLNANQAQYGLMIGQNDAMIINQMMDLTMTIQQMEQDAYSALGVEYHGQ